MLLRMALVVGLLVLSSTSSASAAVVKFSGNLTSYTAGGAPNPSNLLGAFTGELTVADSGINLSSVTGGYFTFSGGTYNLTGGTVLVGAGSASFILPAGFWSPGFGTPNLGMTVAFTGVSGISGTAINQSQFDLLAGSSATAFSFNNGGTPLLGYNGSITAVPEPGSVALVASLVMGAGGWRLRSRKKSLTASNA